MGVCGSEREKELQTETLSYRIFNVNVCEVLWVLRSEVYGLKFRSKVHEVKDRKIIAFFRPRRHHRKRSLRGERGGIFGS